MDIYVQEVRYAVGAGMRRNGHVHRISILITLVTLATQPTQADYQSALDAYQDGNYKTAMYEWKAVIATPPGKVSPATYTETNYAIGMLYWMGQGVTKDYFEAAKWLNKAAELGHSGAQGKLGYLYTQGITVQQNYETAFYWFSKAARQGDIDGQYNLGIFYLNGWGTQQDKTMAAQYLAAASAQGDEAAEAVLQDILPQEQTVAGRKAGSGDVDDFLNDAGSVDMNDTHPVDMNVHPTGGRAQLEFTFLLSSWILAQNPDHYTIQVIGLRSKSALEKLVHGYNHLAPFAIYTLQRGNKPLHLLVQGVYPDVETARKARDKFPTAIQKPEKVWIRKFGKIQELIDPVAQAAVNK